jgi:CubicO group peptidase (beta-lactamase class C family)
MTWTSPTVALLVAVALLGGAPSGMAQPAATLDDAVAALLEPGDAGRTRALLVQRDGRRMIERYAPGFGAETRFASWSVAKTVTALAVGLLVADGKLALDAPAPVAAWQAGNDPRAAITLRHLLTMTSGLAHREGAAGGRPVHTSDAVRMLFTTGGHDTAAYSAAQPLDAPPGTRWVYSTATTQILADLVTRAAVGDLPAAPRRARMAAWFRDRLWSPLGITSAEFDFDTAGTFLGCCLLHMSAGDYLRLGQMLLDDGRSPAGTVVVPAAWLDILRGPTGASNDNHYGGHLWRNTGPAPGQPPILFHPRGSADIIAAVGHHGQFVIADRPRRLVIVRLGQATSRERGPLRFRLADLLEALP